MKVTGKVKNIVYRNNESFWSVLDCTTENGVARITGVTSAREGQDIVAYGKWEKDKNDKPQFVAEAITVNIPRTASGMLKYLSSGAVPGVGPATAKKLVEHFGEALYDTLDADTERLYECKSIDKKRLVRIAENWKLHKVINEIVLFLSTRGVPISLANRIYEEFGDSALHVLNKNPYELSVRMKGVGFKSADKIAIALGMSNDDYNRVRAGVVYALGQEVSNGSCGQYMDVLVKNACDLLSVPEEVVRSVIQKMLNEEKPYIEMHDLVVYRADLAQAEVIIADLLLSRLDKPHPLAKDIDALIDAEEKELGFTLAPKQREAAKMALTYKACILTGGPGCGKTATLNVILSLLKKLNVSVSLAAPTGKAAQRATEATGIPAETLHRLMKIDGKEDAKPQAITTMMLSTDEFGMVDTVLMKNICEAVDINTRMLMVGDYDQLLSVGPGAVLRDLINCGVVPVVRLDQVFRQAKGSLIIENAHNINKGLSLKNGKGPDDDFWIITDKNYQRLAHAKQSNEEHALALEVARFVSHLVSERIPEKRGIDPRDIWVLTPTNKGPCGVDYLNKLLQDVLNPSPESKIMSGSTRLGVGDRVIQTQNDYELEIYNGDTGYIEDIDYEEGVVHIRFEGRSQNTVIPFESLSGLRLGYAMTIHRSQGSQAKAVVIPMLMQHYKLLQRNLIYTGITRAKELVVLVGENDSIELACSRNDGDKRLTRLQQLMLDG